jgi:hypothetical protein
MVDAFPFGVETLAVVRDKQDQRRVLESQAVYGVEQAAETRVDVIDFGSIEIPKELPLLGSSGV